MGQYDIKGSYGGYDKNNKEREALDFYSTPAKELLNILKELNIDFTNDIILENSAGNGKIIQGMLEYGIKPEQIIATDIKDRGNCTNIEIKTGLEYDFLQSSYYENIGSPKVDWVIMNPPFKLIEPFVLKSLAIAKKGVIMFGRIQFLEGQNRYELIHSTCPPTDVYGYVDRVACYKNGDETIKPDSIQMYAWYVWDKNKIGTTNYHFLRRAQ